MLRVLVTAPAFFVTLPLLLFRYQTLRYRFDDEGVGMRWGILFRHEINLTYARIQDIHLSSNVFQRWLGLADIKIQTASGSASAEMTIEGLREFEAVRDFLYARMRGQRAGGKALGAASGAGSGSTSAGAGLATGEAVALLREIHGELQATRALLESQAPQRPAGSPAGEARGDG
ncbi:PH domain-containing protein [Pseudenhygromyxa sp. WMMC2535]|nr:PH domain-containing protein [Pseudenhygromyxa sp. WMMC2535]NVB43317.1 PH domain-containing protein [Pseudenhygromyxa sp. WMMC2535]